MRGVDEDPSLFGEFGGDSISVPAEREVALSDRILGQTEAEPTEPRQGHRQRHQCTEGCHHAGCGRSGPTGPMAVDHHHCRPQMDAQIPELPRYPAPAAGHRGSCPQGRNGRSVLKPQTIPSQKHRER
mmetsp:Transcript_13249/g.27748  ORF Transcript_13249/g.27748 Transcript_13249/m.27748 type:complete len:128 (-) Transcript_13249:343-726(-)